MPVATAKQQEQLNSPLTSSPVPRKSAINIKRKGRISIDAPASSPLRASDSNRTIMPASSSSSLSQSQKSNQGQGHINDDKAEKANRRKSAHFGPLPSEGTGATSGMGHAQAKRTVSALAMQGRRKRLSAVNPELPVISLEERQGNFEEWMKLATDNVSGPSPGRTLEWPFRACDGGCRGTFESRVNLE
jgi:hypothetical protein